jgi:hypothetical protein
MRPDRIVVGEVRGAEVLEMLQAMNTGHDGSMATIHANSPRDCLYRIEMLAGFAGFQGSEDSLRRQIASAIDFIVQISRLGSGRRVLVSITEITGVSDNLITTQEMFRHELQIDGNGRRSTAGSAWASIRTRTSWSRSASSCANRSTETSEHGHRPAAGRAEHHLGAAGAGGLAVGHGQQPRAAPGLAAARRAAAGARAPRRGPGRGIVPPPTSPARPPAAGAGAALDGVLQRGPQPGWKLPLMLLVPGLVLVVAALRLGTAWMFPLTLLLYLLGCWLWVMRRTTRLRAQLLHQLPDFLDNLVRLTALGNSLQAAFQVRRCRPARRCAACWTPRCATHAAAWTWTVH